MLRKTLDKMAKHFEKGGKLHRFYAIWEMQDTILFTPGYVTKGGTHVRDALDLKRMMILVVMALIPAMLMALYNTGYQANQAISTGAMPLDSWQEAIYTGLGFTFAPSFWGNIVLGAVYFLPVLIVTFAAGGAIEVIFALTRGHEINEGFLVTGALIPLTLPPTIPLWQVAVGTMFGVMIGKEIFGGTGMNVLNPALTARAFLFFAYPAQISGDKVWIAANMTDGMSGATPLGIAAADSSSLVQQGLGSEAWMDAFLGFIPGSMGETSALALLLGAAVLVFTQIGSYRTMLGVAIGTIVMALTLNSVGSETNPMFALPFYWHMVLGGWALGAIFMATDPVSSAFTDRGKWIYGFFIGVLVVLVRVVNPAYPEGMMLAILFMNMFAPLVDYFIVQGNIKRRLARKAGGAA
ncbi:MAG: NADH:ubiquinone reductase (Na(+)-transporting) subunit B [Planctomycetota bacterium]|nr:MAG: NADH:ubiquinone reductase (Na(+)-transporting) subunit B [Planctomycetota bacterium]